MAESNNIDETLVQAVQKYIAEHTPKLYILTPCYGSICYTNYVASIMNTADIFKQLNFPMQVEFCRNDSLVSRARNNLIARAMSDPKTTHILFIDSDITWHPLDILKLIIAHKPIIGGAYPLKAYKWEKLQNPETGKYDGKMMETWIDKKNKSDVFKNMIDDKSMVQFNLLQYNINYLSNTLNIDDNLTKVKHLATGFMMIQRETLDKMMKAFPSTKYIDDIGFLQGNENDYAYALFDCGVEEGHYFSEDWMFCKRWSRMGGDVWLDVSINLVHTGIEDFKGCYVASLL